MSNEHVNSTVRSILDTICPPVGATTGATMGEPVKPVAPVTVEVSDDQNTATVVMRLEFVEFTLMQYMACEKCHGKRRTICNTLPCGFGQQRDDNKSGYFREVRG